jgi:hypothetical protein
LKKFFSSIKKCIEYPQADFVGKRPFVCTKI